MLACCCAIPAMYGSCGNCPRFLSQVRQEGIRKHVMEYPYFPIPGKFEWSEWTSDTTVVTGDLGLRRSNTTAVKPDGIMNI
jgi:hypothetical protein